MKRYSIHHPPPNQNEVLASRSKYWHSKMCRRQSWTECKQSFLALPCNPNRRDLAFDFVRCAAPPDSGDLSRCSQQHLVRVVLAMELAMVQEMV
jgi:hypothetical protein